jgi:hypothetical protein
MCLLIMEKALLHEGVWGSEHIDPRIIDLGTSWEWSASSLGKEAPVRWVGLIIGLDNTERKKV